MTMHEKTLESHTRLDAEAKWAWACRAIDRSRSWSLGPMPTEVGDVVVARVTRISHHARIVDASGARRRIYRGDLVVGTLGHRYATDAFHGEARDDGGRIHLLTNAGMMGTVISRHSDTRAPTELELLGTLVSTTSLRPLNLITERFSPKSRTGEAASKLVLVLGTGMNAGKTTSARKLIRGLRERHASVAAVKLTGSVSPGDWAELADAGASYVADFSDYGFPSTHRLDEHTLMALVETILADAEAARPEVIVAEIADGILQSETEVVVRCLAECSSGAVLAAPCALAAMAAVGRIEAAGVEVLAVTGLISNAPLFIREFESLTNRAVVTSADDGRALGGVVSAHLRSDALSAEAA